MKQQISDIENIYKTRSLSPMLLGSSKPFDDPEFLFEPKYDGARALFYIDDADIHIVSRNGNDLTEKFPEFWNARDFVQTPCVLDGEIFGQDFATYLKRGSLQNAVRIQLAVGSIPMQFAAFDILYQGQRNVTGLPLCTRKDILTQTLRQSERLIVVESIPRCGVAFFSAAKQAGLEGIVAKRKNSVYLVGQRSHDWLKMKS